MLSFVGDIYKDRISLDDPDIFQSKFHQEIESFKKNIKFSNSDMTIGEEKILETPFKLAKAQKYLIKSRTLSGTSKMSHKNTYNIYHIDCIAIKKN